MFDSIAPSAVFPPEGAGCRAGLQGGRTHGAEDIIFDLMGSGAQWIPFRQYDLPSKDFGKDAAGCVAAVENVAMEVRGGEQPVFLCCNDANKVSEPSNAVRLDLTSVCLPLGVTLLPFHPARPFLRRLLRMWTMLPIATQQSNPTVLPAHAVFGCVVAWLLLGCSVGAVPCGSALSASLIC